MLRWLVVRKQLCVGVVQNTIYSGVHEVVVTVEEKSITPTWFPSAQMMSNTRKCVLTIDTNDLVISKAPKSYLRYLNIKTL